MTKGDLAWMALIFGPAVAVGLILIGVGLRRRSERRRDYLSQPGDYACATSDTGVALACEESARRSRERRRADKATVVLYGKPARGRWRRV